MGRELYVNKALLPLLVISTLGLSACSTVSGWFADDEELEIRTLKPINAEFTPTTLWDTELGDGISHYFSRLKPAVGYDMVFAANRQGKVAAFNKETGKEIWHKDYAVYNNEGFTSSITNLWSSGASAKIAGGLAVAYETLFFGTENGDVTVHFSSPVCTSSAVTSPFSVPKNRVS